MYTKLRKYAYIKYTKQENIIKSSTQTKKICQTLWSNLIW